jgi:hypothetical protein
VAAYTWETGMKVLLIVAAALALSVSSASARARIYYPVAAYPQFITYPNGAPWCAYGYDCRFLNFAHCAEWSYAGPESCSKNPFFLAAYPVRRRIWPRS